MREDIIIPLVEGKRVLDCGGVDHFAHLQRQAAGVWLHAILANHVREILGVDILQDKVDAINRAGQYHFVCANIEEMTFREEFDVVVGGEVIEHLYNPGRFLTAAWNALRPQGALILTTPNAHSVAQLFSVIFRRREQTHPEHTCMYTRQTLEYLVRHHGFQQTQVHCIDRAAKRKLVGVCRSWIIRVFPSICETLVLVVRKGEAIRPYEDKW